MQARSSICCVLDAHTVALVIQTNERVNAATRVNMPLRLLK
jgi:uncharacterized membrane protein YcgQ (UPF0703/DUF1980 family)